MHLMTTGGATHPGVLARNGFIWPTINGAGEIPSDETCSSLVVRRTTHEHARCSKTQPLIGYPASARDGWRTARRRFTRNE
jgi:hypothetical protein